nr:hypothetical protein [Tanacetum cinerariifolium]
MTSFANRLNPLYPIKECSSCGALYTTDYCCSVGTLADKIICDLDKTPEFSQRSPQNCPKYGNPVQDSSEPSNDNSNVVNAPREPFVVNQDPDRNSSQSSPQINHHCCYGCGDPLEGILCRQCTCELCGNGAHYGYNCPPKVMIIPDPKPFHNQTIKELPPTMNDSRYGHYCTPQVLFVYLEPCYDQDFNFLKEFQGFHDFQQQDICCENCGVTHEAYQCQPKNKDYYHQQRSCSDSNSFGFNQFQPQQYTVNHLIFNAQNELFDSQNKLMEQLTSMCNMVSQLIQKKEEEKKIKEAQAANARYWKIHACYDDENDYNFAITPNKPVNSLKFTTFLNVLFDADYEFDYSDDQSFSYEDAPEKIFSNPLFEEDTIPMKIDQHPHNVESDLIESPRIHDSSLIISSKIDSLLDEFADELALLKSIPPGIDETDCVFKEDICLIEKLLYDNSSPRRPKEFVSENSDAEIESFSLSPIPVKDSDSRIEEIDLSFTPDYPMPSGIEDDDYDSERDIIISEDLLSNDTLSLLEIESFHFDIPSFSCPPAKPPDGDTRILNIKMTGDISDQKVPMPTLMITLVPHQEKSPDLYLIGASKLFSLMLNTR